MAHKEKSQVNSASRSKERGFPRDRVKADLSESYEYVFWFIVFILAFIYSGLFIIVSCGKYFNFKYTDWDLAIYNQMFYGALHGKPYSSLMDLPYLGTHVEITSVLLLPIYALFSSPLTLLIIQSLFLGLAAVPLYMIAKEKLDNSWGVIFVIIYLLYPAVGFTNLNEYHPESFLPLIQFFLFYFFLKNNFKKFFVFLLLCVLSKENMSLMMIMLGFYAWIDKRPRRWSIVPILSGVIWFFVYKFLIFPVFCGDKVGMMSIYAHLGNNFFQIFQNILFHPIQVLRMMLMPQKLLYLSLLFGPLSFLPLFCPLILLITLPNFLQHLLSLRPMEYSIYFYYPSECLAFIFIAAIFGLKYLLSFKPIKKVYIFLALILLGVSIHFFLSYWPYRQINADLRNSFKNSPEVVFKNKCINRIPEESSVVATFKYLPKLSSKTRRLYSFHRVLTGTYQFSDKKFELPQDVNFALIDFDDPLTFGSFYQPGQTRDNFLDFFKENKWGVLEASDNTLLLKKGELNRIIVCESRDRLPETVKPNGVVFNDKVQLLSYKMEKEFLDGAKRIHFTFYWQLAEGMKEPYFFISRLVNPLSKETVYLVTHPFCYRFYPASGVNKPQEIIEENYWISLPSYLPGGDYRVLSGLFSLSPYLSEKLVSHRGWVDMGAFNQ